jgi:hypothetical protein
MPRYSQATRKAAEAQLVASVRNFNSRIRSAIKRGKLPAEFAPEPVKAREILAPVRNLPAYEATIELKRRTRQLEKARGKALNIKTTQAGAKTTEWEYRTFLENQRAINRQRKKAAQTTGAMIDGKRTDGVQAAYTRQVSQTPLRYKPSQVKPSEFRELAGALRRMSTPKQQKYYDSFVKAMKNRYSGEELSAILKALRKAGALGLDEAYRSGADEMDLNNYPESKDGSPVLKRAGKPAQPGAPALDLPSGFRVAEILTYYATRKSR